MKHIFACGILLAMLALLPGCKRRSAKAPAAAPAGASLVIEVITDPAQLAAARAVFARHQEELLSEALVDPATIHVFDHEVIDLLKGNRQRALAALTAFRDDPSRPAAKRVDAAAALKLLDVAPDTRQLDELARSSPEAMRELLWKLTDIYGPKAPPPAALHPLLITALNSQDEPTRRQAALMIGQHRIAQATNAVLARLGSDAKPDATLLSAAAKLSPTREVLDVIIKRLKTVEEHDQYFVLLALCDFADAANDPPLRRAAVDACATHLRTVPDHPSIGAELTALKTIADSKPPESAKSMLADLVRASRHRYVRSYALADLQKLDANLAAAVSTETGVNLPEAAAKTPPSSQRKLTAEQAASLCVRHGLLTQLEADQALVIHRQRRSSTRPADPVEEEDASEHTAGLAKSLLEAAGRYTAFDVETGVFPNRHDLLLLDLAKASAGRFKPEAPQETFTPDAPNSESGKYLVQFIHAGRLYHFRPQDQGDWYDLPAVLAAVDRACADAGVAERFIALSSDGQIAELIFARPEALRAAAEELGLKISSDSDEARKQGKAYEDRVIQQLDKK